MGKILCAFRWFNMRKIIKYSANFFVFIMHRAALLVFSIRHRLLNPVPSNKLQHNLTVISLISGEERYLGEFIRFHVLQGVDHFVFYDNSDSSYQSDALQPFIESGIVTLYSCPNFSFLASWLLRKNWSVSSRLKPHMQEIVFAHFLSKNKNANGWVIQIDIDEFVYCIGQSLAACIKKYQDQGVRCIEIQQFEFGSSGIVDYPLSVIESYKMRSNSMKSRKSMGMFKYISSAYSAHVFSNRRSVMQEFIQGPRSPRDFPKGAYLVLPRDSSNFNIYLNHYKYKCLRDIVERRFNKNKFPSGYNLSPSVIPELFSINNEVECDLILRSLQSANAEKQER